MNAKILAIAAAVTGLGGSAFGITWNISGAGLFNNANNWDLARVPGAGDYVDISIGTPTVSGYNGTIGELHLQNNGLVIAASSSLSVTTASGGSGYARIGTGSGTASLNISQGGTFSDADGIIAMHAGSTGTATVAGTWTNTVGLSVGYAGNGTLNVLAGGVVDGGGFIVLGADVASARGAVTVDGTLTTSGQLTVGGYGTGTMTVQGGGDVVSGTGVIGNTSSANGTVTVTGVGSTWTNNGILYIGGSSAGASSRGTLNIQDGGLVTVASTLKLWYLDATHYGQVNISNGTLIAGTLDLGSTAAQFSDNAGSTVRVNSLAGGPSNISFNGILQLGHSGGTGNYTVAAGKSLAVGTEIDVGYNSAGTLAVAGNLTAGHLIMGLTGGNGTVTIQNGGSAVVGSGAGWTRVGYAGTGTLNVNAGGHLTDSVSFIGSDATSTGTATVAGTWTNTSDLTVGFDGNGTLNVGAGGVVDGGTFISIGRNGTSSRGAVTVDGTLTTSGQLAVGAMGTGTMTVRNGGDVVSGDSRIGQYTGANGTATVTGAGSTWTENSSMYVGGSAAGNVGTGTLNVSNGAALSVANTLKIWSGDDAVNFSGGTIAANTIDISSGGAFNFTGGTLHTVTFKGNLLNQGGTLAPGSSPGLTTVEGNYTQSAGILDIELGGRARGTQYDALNVMGSLTLGGTLNVSLWNGFNPALSDTFNILDWGSVHGLFSTINLPLLSGNLQWDQSRLYTTGEIGVVPEPSVLALVLGAGAMGVLALRLRGFRARPAGLRPSCEAR